jgi:hypothetical protein
VEFRTESRLDALMYGAMLALLMHRTDTRRWIYDNLKQWHMVALLCILRPSLVLIEIVFFRRTAVAIFFPILIGYTVLNSSGLVGKFLDASVPRWVGRLSYSIYIWQMLFLGMYYMPLGEAQQFPLNLVLVLWRATILSNVHPSDSDILYRRSVKCLQRIVGLIGVDVRHRSTSKREHVRTHAGRAIAGASSRRPQGFQHFRFLFWFVKSRQKG